MQLSVGGKENSAPGNFISMWWDLLVRIWFHGGLVLLFDYGDIDVDFVEFILQLLAVVWLICRPHKESHCSISKTIKITHDRLHCRHFISLAWNFCKDTQNFSDIIYRCGKIIIYGYFHLKHLFLGKIKISACFIKSVNQIRRPDNHRIKQLSPQIAW